MADVLVSFVVPAYNEEKEIAACLTSIRSACDQATEIIVVDNNCTDGTKAIASLLADKVVPCPVQGISAARNAGAASARGEWIAFVDADARICANWLFNARRTLSRRKVDALSGWNFFREPNPFLFSYFNGYDAVFFTAFLVSLAMGRSLVVGNNLLIRRSTLNAAGGFPRFVGEDIKLSRILHRLGGLFTAIFPSRITGLITNRNKTQNQPFKSACKKTPAPPRKVWLPRSKTASFAKPWTAG